MKTVEASDEDNVGSSNQRSKSRLEKRSEFASEEHYKSESIDGGDERNSSSLDEINNSGEHEENLDSRSVYEIDGSNEPAKEFNTELEQENNAIEQSEPSLKSLNVKPDEGSQVTELVSDGEGKIEEGKVTNVSPDLVKTENISEQEKIEATKEEIQIVYENESKKKAQLKRRRKSRAVPKTATGKDTESSVYVLKPERSNYMEMKSARSPRPKRAVSRYAIPKMNVVS